MRKLTGFVGLFLCLASAQVLAQSKPVSNLNRGAERLVYFETRGNAVAIRDNKAIPMPHLEIPLRLIEADFAERMNPLIREALIFEKDGEKYARWILNPEDTKWGKLLIEAFAKEGVMLEPKNYFTGYQTASRSYIAQDPVTGFQFSVKASTNITGGNWKDKNFPVSDAQDSRRVADFLFAQNGTEALKNIVLMDEPAALYAKNADQAMLIRDLADLNQPDKKLIYLPGFSALHELVGTRIATLNGSKSPYEFWTKHYIEATGRALGELAARTGLQYDSPHSQNFLIELTDKYVPTGRIVMRDFADVYVMPEYIDALHPDPKKFLGSFYEGNILQRIQVGFGPLHGNSKPSWVTEPDYSKWKDKFFDAFQESFTKISGLDPSLFKRTRQQTNDYFGGVVQFKNPTQADIYFESIADMELFKHAGSMFQCRKLYSTAP